jgi:hypothetical protein
VVTNQMMLKIFSYILCRHPFLTGLSENNDPGRGSKKTQDQGILSKMLLKNRPIAVVDVTIGADCRVKAILENVVEESNEASLALGCFEATNTKLIWIVSRLNGGWFR